MAPKWRSPLLPPLGSPPPPPFSARQRHNDDISTNFEAPPQTNVRLRDCEPYSCGDGGGGEEEDEEERARSDGRVSVPSAGLYGLCFGHASSAMDSMTIEGGGDGGDFCRCGCVCVASFRLAGGAAAIATNGEGERSAVGGWVRELALPFPDGGCNALSFVGDGADDDDDDDDGMAAAAASSAAGGDGRRSVTTRFLASPRVGRILYLPAGTVVSVRRREGGSHPPRSAEGERREDGCSLRWRLVLHRKLLGGDGGGDGGDRGGKRRRTEDGDAAAAATVDLNPPDCRSKPVLCADCGRKFPRALSVRNHALSAHGPPPSGEEGGGGAYGMGRVGGEGGGDGDDLGPAVMGPPVLRRSLTLAHDDPFVAVVVKPQGIAVQGERWTLSRSDLFLPFRAKEGSGVERPLTKPVAVHRLDSATGGLLVLAKTKPAEVFLRSAFAERTCKKRYRAIVFGRLVGDHRAGNSDGSDDGGGSVGSGVGRVRANGRNVDGNGVDGDGGGDAPPAATGVIESSVSGRPSRTRFSVIRYSRSSHPAAGGWITTVDLFPETGRKHQLRRHCKLIGHPIWGDRRYGPYRCWAGGDTWETGDGRGGGASTGQAEGTAKVEGAKDSANADGKSMEGEKGSNRNLGGEDVVCSNDWSLLDGATPDKYPHIKMCLWALEISFPHPVAPSAGGNGGEEKRIVTAQIDEPEWYEALRRDQEQQWRKDQPNVLDEVGSAGTEPRQGQLDNLCCAMMPRTL